MEAFLETYGSVHRGSGLKSVISTAVYEGTADVIRRFVGAGDDDLVVAAGNTTQAINRLAPAPQVSARGHRFHLGDWSTLPMTCPGGSTPPSSVYDPRPQELST